MENEYLTYIVAFWLPTLFFLGVEFIPKYLHKRKIKKFKYEWWWILKKVIVSAAKERYEDWSDNSWYYVYRLEAKDEDWNFYRSEDLYKAKHGWRTIEEMKKKYDWVIYDLSDKDNVIKQISDNIDRLEMELQNNPWFFRKMSLKHDLKSMKNYLDIANEWPITPYLVCNGHKISVWDSVDVYVSPNNPNNYYFDLEFTEEKENAYLHKNTIS